MVWSSPIGIQHHAAIPLWSLFCSCSRFSTFFFTFCHQPVFTSLTVCPYFCTICMTSLVTLSFNSRWTEWHSLTSSSSKWKLVARFKRNNDKVSKMFDWLSRRYMKEIKSCLIRLAVLQIFGVPISTKMWDWFYFMIIWWNTKEICKHQMQT